MKPRSDYELSLWRRLVRFVDGESLAAVEHRAEENRENDAQNQQLADIEADIAAIEEENAALHLANGLIIEDSPDKKEADFINEIYNNLYRAGSSRKTKYAKSPVISAENFENLKNYCEAYVNSIVLQTKNGMISACPKNDDKCAYCEYSLFCGHEKEAEEE